MNCNFRVGYKHFYTTALIDTGNNFRSCVSELFALSLGFSPDLLAPSPTRLTKQAGAGAILKVIGLLPAHMISNSFKMENCPFQFTFHQIFVIKGLNQNVNISLPFLQKYKFIIDLDQNHFQFNHNDQKFNISFVLRNSTRISMTEMTADFPKSGISGPPGQKIHVQTIYGIVEQIFTPRPPRIGNKPKQTDLDLKPTGPDINFVPWRVLSNSNDPRGSLRVKDLSEKRRTLHDQFKLDYLCNITPPLNKPKLIPVPVRKEGPLCRHR